MTRYFILECTQSSVSDESDTDDEYMIPPDAALGYVEPSSFGRSSSSEEAARNRKYTTTMPTSSHDNVSRDSNNYNNDPCLLCVTLNYGLRHCKSCYVQGV